MARQRRMVTYRTGALLLLLCVCCLLVGRSASPDRDTGLRAHGIVHVTKDSLKTVPGMPNRAGDTDRGAPVGDLTGAFTVATLLLAVAVAVATATARRRLRLAAVTARAPPGSSALA